MTDLFDRIDSYVEERFDLDPVEATNSGAEGRDDRLTDLSLAGEQARVDLDRRFLAELADLTPGDESEAVALAFARERLTSRIESFEAGEHLRALSTLWSPIQSVRDVFTMMPDSSDADWHNIATRLAGVPAALSQARESLAAGIAAGLTAARRQALGVAHTCAVTAGLVGEGDAAPAPWFTEFVGGYEGTDLVLRGALDDAARAATQAYADAAAWLTDVYAPAATPNDAVGAERYALHARLFTGAALDLHETYAWGWEELARLHERIDAVVERVTPGRSLLDTVAALNADPKYTIEGEAALVDWLQDVIDTSVVELNGTYFDIPEIMQRCEARIAPPGGAAAQYYTQPSEDFSRPGRTWWPTQGMTTFFVWDALSTWYHEGVPGHHQQAAYTILQRDRLSRLQRIEFLSGHGEGWALYAERLMDELGKFDDPGFELGYLRGQALRAVRVIVDIGMHLELPIPDVPLATWSTGSHVGEIWHRDLAVEFMIERAMLERYFAESEADRYLGLPGQAISYKVGERVWLAARAAAQQRHGADFSLYDWHNKALALGPLGLDPFYELASQL